MKQIILRVVNKFFLFLTLFAISLSAFTSAVSNSALVNAADDKSSKAAPYAMDWHITGPSGGDVRALVFDPNDEQRLYFGTLDSQLYVSTDGGQQWRMLHNFNRPKLFLDHIIVDPRDPKTIYVGAHRHKEPGGFFKTIDGGLTWRESSELKGEAIHSLTQSSSDPDVLVAGTNHGIFRSDDAGETWTRSESSATSGVINVESLAIDPRNTDVIYAGTWYLPYKSSDGGKSWKVIKTGMIDDSDVFAIDIDPRNPNHIIASACSGIYDSRNGGENWRKVNGIPSQSRRTRAILQHPSLPGAVFAGTTEGFWRSTKGGDDGSWRLTTSKQLEINSIAVHPKNPQTIFIGTNNYGVMVSRDGGRSFAPTNGGYSGRFVNSILADREQPGRVYATTINTATGGGFFFVSDDSGMTWKPSTRNMPKQLVSYSMLQDERDGNIIYLGTNFGIYHSLDRGASWAPVTSPKVEPPPPAPKRKRNRRQSRAAAAPAEERANAAPEVAKRSSDAVKRAQEALIIAGYNPGAADGQAGTRTVSAIRKFQADKGLPVSGKLDDATLAALTTLGQSSDAPLVLTDKINVLTRTHDERDGKPGIFAATNAGLYRSYDLTEGWEKLSYGSSLDSRTTCISVTPRDPKMIWVGTATSGVLVSRDGGMSWEQVPGVPSIAPISAIEQDRQRSSHIYVGTNATFYMSRDGGQNWLRRGGNLPSGNYASILINPASGDEIIVGNAWENGGGVYRSTDAGTTWTRIDPRDPQLPSQRIWALAYDTRGQNRIFVGSHSSGVYVADRSPVAALSVDR